MGNSFVWIISQNAQNSLIRRGVSPYYIIPKEVLNENHGDIVQSTLWIVTRGHNDTVTACLRPKTIESFTEGIHEGDYLITVEVNDSFKVVNLDGNWNAYKTHLFVEYQPGITRIPNEVEKELETLIKERIQTKIQDPPKSIRKWPFDSERNKNLRFWAKIAVNEILKNYSLDETWGSKFGIILPPFANFAHALLKERFDRTRADESLQFLKEFDPLYQFNNAVYQTSSEMQEKEKWASQNVNLDFVPIDPEMIYARKFIMSKVPLTQMEASLAKTEMAEQLHQEMLRDISTYLIRKNIIPFQSDSIDLMFEFSDETYLIEIKSTNRGNLIAQCAKGVFQLAYYGDAFRSEISSPTLKLVIHKTENVDQEETCIRVINRLATEVLIYNPSKEWPDRLPGLLPVVPKRN
jgi:hypothetical protein